MTPVLAAGPVPYRPLPKPKVDISSEARETSRCILAAMVGSYVASGRLPEEVADHRTAGFPPDVVAHAEADRGEFDAWVDMLLEALEGDTSDLHRQLTQALAHGELHDEGWARCSRAAGDVLAALGLDEAQEAGR